VSDNNTHINNLTPELITRYYEGSLSNEEMHQVEKLMLESDFDSDAMEGFENIPADEWKKDLHKLNKRLDEKVDKTDGRDVFFYLKIAASILLVAVSFFLIIEYLEPTDNQITQAEDELEVKPEVNKEKSILLEEADSTVETPLTDSIQTKEFLESPDLIAENNIKETIAEEDISQTNSKDVMESMDRITLNEVVPDEESLEDDPAPTTIRKEHAFEGRAAGVHTEEESLTRDNVSRSRTKKLASKTQHVKSKSALDSEIQGKVISAEDGEPLPGINVAVKGTATGTVTDEDGSYNISIPQGTDSTLVFSFVGLASNQVDASGMKILNVEMESDVRALSEVVVVGYGASSEEDNTANTYEKAKPNIDMSAYKEYIEQNIQYPEGKTEKGRVVVKFKVNADGSLSDFELQRSLGDDFDREAIRLIKEGPDWIPAKKNGETVEDTVQLKIPFKP